MRNWLALTLTVRTPTGSTYTSSDGETPSPGVRRTCTSTAAGRGANSRGVYVRGARLSRLFLWLRTRPKQATPCGPGRGFSPASYLQRVKVTRTLVHQVRPPQLDVRHFEDVDLLAGRGHRVSVFVHQIHLQAEVGRVLDKDLVPDQPWTRGRGNTPGQGQRELRPPAEGAGSPVLSWKSVTTVMSSMYALGVVYSSTVRWRPA